MKRRSTTSKQSPELTFFLDRNLGKEKLAGRLREADFTVEIHDEKFSPTEDDPIWLLWCGNEELVVITPDVRIKNEPKSLEAILAGKTRVFLLSTNQITSERWAETLIGCRAKILRVLKKNPGPFISRITSDGRVWGTEQITREMIDERGKRAYEKRQRKTKSKC